MINRIFDTLEDWRHLPGYQLERRADIFFAVHIDAIFRGVLDVDVRGIIPEFPVRIGTIYPETHINKSFKIDYAVFGDDTCYLVELKTDDGSIRDSQHRYYQKTIETGFMKVTGGILEICNETSPRFRHKYRWLVEKLVGLGAIENGKPANKYSFYEKPVFFKPTGENDDAVIVINFDRIRTCLETLDNEVSRAFAEKLSQWKSPA